MPDDTTLTAGSVAPATDDGVEAPRLSEAEELASAPIPAPPRPKLGILFWCCVAWLAIIAFLVAFSGVLHLEAADGIDYTAGPNATLSMHHLLGTDDNGRDILSRVINGARVSVVIGLCATGISLVIGGFLGMLSAYARGALDALLSTVMFIGLAFPAIVAVLAILEFWGHSELHIILLIGFFGVPLIFRVVRASTLACATKEYVTAARSQGATSIRVLARDIFPNVLPSLLAYAVITFGGVIGVEGALGFLGQSVAQPAASWGNMLAEASSNSSNLPLVLAPSLALFFTLVALYYSGERLRLRYDTGETRL